MLGGRGHVVLIPGAKKGSTRLSNRYECTGTAPRGRGKYKFCTARDLELLGMTRSSKTVNGENRFIIKRTGSVSHANCRVGALKTPKGKGKYRFCTQEQLADLGKKRVDLGNGNYRIVQAQKKASIVKPLEGELSTPKGKGKYRYMSQRQLAQIGKKRHPTTNRISKLSTAPTKKQKKKTKQKKDYSLARTTCSGLTVAIPPYNKYRFCSQKELAELGMVRRVVKQTKRKAPAKKAKKTTPKGNGSDASPYATLTLAKAAIKGKSPGTVVHYMKQYKTTKGKNSRRKAKLTAK